MFSVTVRVRLCAHDLESGQGLELAGVKEKGSLWVGVSIVRIDMGTKTKLDFIVNRWRHTVSSTYRLQDALKRNLAMVLLYPGRSTEL